MPPSEKPVLLLTCGDPAGIGPEIIVKAWAATPSHAHVRLRVVADVAMLAAVLADRPGLPRPQIVGVEPGDPRDSAADKLLVIDPVKSDASRNSDNGRSGVHDRSSLTATAETAGGRASTHARVEAGVVSAAGGASAAAAVETASRLVREGSARGIVTGPLHKAALHAAGFDVPGHTEMLARSCGLADSDVSMMLWLPKADKADAADASAGLGVVHVTLHESLAHAVARLSTEAIVQAGTRLAGLLGSLLGRRPRIAVAALNPHGGESGLFGDEESQLIAPAVRCLAEMGIDVTGPLPADTLFLRASRGAFDGVVAMYHDQGHIPIKLLGMHRAVNITLGLPMVRTSVAHGTAFDIVGTGAADPASMLAAIDAAVRLVAAGWPADSLAG
jgi:4-hydroxythreonine-4-phosphate dehydrogenase